MMRLEYLFQQLFSFSQSPDAKDQHVALGALFQLLDVCDRGDCRTWVLQELEKQKMSLEHYQDFPEIDTRALDITIKKLNTVAHNLASGNKLGTHIRANNWLLTLRNRFLMPGTTSPIDFPAYAAWLSGPEQDRVRVIQNLVKPFMPLYEAIQQSLALLRDAAEPQEESSKSNGVFEKTIGGKVYQMARIWVPSGRRIYPEMSGNKHIVMIRFFRMKDDFSHQLLSEPLAFKLALCQI